MGDRLVRKGLALGVIVLFVCVGISSAVAIKEVNANNNDIINSSNDGSTEDLPDLKIIYIETVAISHYEDEPAVQETHVGIKNIGAASLNGYVNIKIFIFNGIGLLRRIFKTSKRLEIAPGQEKYLFMEHDICVGGFLRFVVFVNYDKFKKESDYRTNVAMQIFYTQAWFWDNFLIKIGFLRYPFFLIPNQLGI